MRRFLAFLLLLTLCPPVPAQTLAGDLQALLDEQRLTGAVVATVAGEQTERLALGRFRSDGAAPLRPEHRVQVGSIAKTVAALAVLRLATQGRVDLDAPLDALLPEVRLDNPWAARSPVRLRHLLDMTAGLPDVQLWHVFHTGHAPNAPLRLALREEAGPLRLRSEPGRQFSYSNLGFLLVGMVVEAVTGERYAAWAERELLRPLGMRESRLVFRSQPEDPDLAWGHLDSGEPVADGPSSVLPAAHLHTTAADMARLMRFLLGDGRVGGEAFVRADFMAGLGRSPGTDTARAGLRSGYGLGLLTRDRHGAVGLCHGGSIAGWRAMFCVYREQQRGFFIALNHDREGADYGRFDARLVQQLGVARPLPAASTAPMPAEHAAWRGLYVPAPGRLPALAPLDRLLGFWWLDLQAGQPPRLREGLGAVRALHPAGPGLYRQEGRQQATLALLRDAQGRPLLGGSYLTLRQVPLWEQGLLWAGALAGLLGVLALLPLLAWRWRQAGLRAASRRVPAAWAVLALAAALGAWGLQGWARLGEPTAVAVALAGASLLLPLAAGWQALHAVRQGGRPEALSAAALLGLCALLAAFGWLPLQPWRL